jgi:hypothetical protein
MATTLHTTTRTLCLNTSTPTTKTRKPGQPICGRTCQQAR